MKKTVSYMYNFENLLRLFYNVVFIIFYIFALNNSYSFLKPYNA